MKKTLFTLLIIFLAFTNYASHCDFPNSLGKHVLLSDNTDGFVILPNSKYPSSAYCPPSAFYRPPSNRPPSTVHRPPLATCSTFNYPVPPADSCHSAPPFCERNLNGYCAINDGNSPDAPGNLPDVFGCSIENNQWIQFTACDISVRFVISVADCQSGAGLEFGVFETTDCEGFTALAACFPIGNGSSDTLEINGLVAGQNYLLMVDGTDGDVCHWEITGLQGVSGEAYLQADITPGNIEGEGEICLGPVGTPFAAFPYTAVAPVCHFLPIDTTCNGESLPCPGAVQQFCEPFLDTLYQPIAYDTIWQIDPPDAGYFVNDDSIGYTVEVVWDSVGVFYLEAKIVPVAWDTIPFWNNCLQLCANICPDPQGDDCVIERKKITTDRPDEFVFDLMKCEGECAYLPTDNGTLEFCAPGVFESWVMDGAGCEDHYVVTVQEIPAMDEYLTLVEDCFGACVFYEGNYYCPGQYELPIIGANGCPATLFLEVYPAPYGGVFMGGDTQIDCTDPTATLTVITSYPEPAYFQWSTGEIGESITVTTAGAYQVIAYSISTGCFIGAASVEVVENIQPPLIDLGEMALCPGECFALLGNNYCNEGSYEAELTDPVSGCTTLYIFTIIFVPQPPLQVGIVTEICDGIQENYTVGFNILSGVLPYRVNGTIINGDFYQSNPIASGESYLFQITDANHCQPSEQIVQGFFECQCISDAGTMATALLPVCGSATVFGQFNQDATLDPNDVLVFVLHDQAGNDLGTVFAVNNTPAFTFLPGLMQHGETYYISPVVGNESNGSVDFSAACVRVGQGQPVVFYPNPEVVLTPPPTLNCLESSGVIQADLLSGTLGGLAIAWSGPGGFQSSDWQPTVAAGGVYSLLLTNMAVGCETTSDVEVEADFEEPTVSLSTSNIIDCNNPTAQLSATAAQPNMAFEWFPPSGNGALGDTYLAQVGGNYTVVATGPNGCTTQTNIEQETDLQPPFLQASDGLITCTNPVVILSGFSGEPGVQFHWLMPNGTSMNDVSITTNMAGAYTVTATATNGCTTERLVHVGEDTELPDLSVAGGEITCLEPNITLEAFTSTLGATMKWIFPTGNEVAGQAVVTSIAGQYTVIATAPNGCTAQQQVVVENNDLFPEFTLTNGAIDCFQTTALLQASTAMQGLVFQWALPTGGTETGASILATMPGIYVVTATAPNGCATTLTTNVQDNSLPPGINVSFGTINCSQPSTTLSASSNLAGVTYQWSYPNGNSVTGNNLPTSVPGGYTVVANAPNGCTAVEVFQVVADVASPTFTLYGDDIACNDPTAVLVAAAASPSTVFTWTLPDGTTTNGALLETTLPGEYQVEALGPNGCLAVETLLVSELSSQVLTLEVNPTNPSCFGEADGFILIGDVLGAQLPIAGTLNGQPIELWEMDGLAAGNYSIEVMDSNGCTGSALVQLTNPQEVIVALGDDVNVKPNELVNLRFQSSIVPSMITWSGPNGQTWAGLEEISILATSNGAYSVTVSDANGCSDTDQLFLFVAGQGQVFVPNVFSPNDDNTNDFLTVFGGPDVEQIQSLRIFNRWGDLVYQKENFPLNDRSQGWDGTFKGKKLPPDVFAYTVEVRFKTGETKEVKGDVLLLK